MSTHLIVYLIWGVDPAFQSIPGASKRSRFRQLQYPSFRRSACTCRRWSSYVQIDRVDFVTNVLARLQAYLSSSLFARSKSHWTSFFHYQKLLATIQRWLYFLNYWSCLSEHIFWKRLGVLSRLRLCSVVTYCFWQSWRHATTAIKTLCEYYERVHERVESIVWVSKNADYSVGSSSPSRMGLQPDGRGTIASRALQK